MAIAALFAGAVGLALSATAQAAGWRMLAMAPKANGDTRVLASAGGDAAILVSAADPIYDGPGDLTVDRVQPGRPLRRWIARRKLLVDADAIARGGVELLIRAADRRRRTRSLSLLRVARDGSVRCGGCGGRRAATAGRRWRAPAPGSPSPG